MTRFLALMFLVGFGVLNTLGNFWFTYGIWPRSWGAYFLFFGLSVVQLILFDAVRENK